MSQVWIASPGGPVEGPCDEQALRERSARGELAPGTLYWREGMSERRPVAELLGPPAPPWQAP
ncbi:MAG TPA: DUF4339 domain-containing protein, partial [Chthonomonadales bacterium]|nr:DUF4339 domain-containing protein [Chthonomonadales bacterium]